MAAPSAASPPPLSNKCASKKRALSAQSGSDKRKSKNKGKGAKGNSAGEKTRTESADPPSRNKSPGVRLLHGRTYDSEYGKTCHQCRQKTRDFSVPCMSKRENNRCTGLFCHKCLLNRRGGFIG